MTTLRMIVSDALRESGIIQIGSEPEAEEFAEGLRLLQVVIDNLIYEELGDRFENVTLDSNTLDNSSTNILSANTRYFCNLNLSRTLYFPPDPQDGSRISIVGDFSSAPLTLNGNGRKVENFTSVILNTVGTDITWFYRNDLGAWKQMSVLTENNDSPFPGAFDQLLTTKLSLRLNPRYGVQTSPEIVDTMRNSFKKFKARYKTRKEVSVEEGLTRLSFTKNRMW